MGQLAMCAALVRDGLLTRQQAADRLGMTPDEMDARTAALDD